MKTTILAIFLAVAATCSAEETTIQLFRKVWKIDAQEAMLGTPIKWSEVKGEVEGFLKEKQMQGHVEKALLEESNEAARRYDASIQVLASKTGKTADELADMFLMGKGGDQWPKIQKAHNLMVGINHILDSVRLNALVFVSDTPGKPVPGQGNKPVTPRPIPTQPVVPGNPGNPPAQPPARALEW